MSDPLALIALRYAANDLPPAEAAAFEARLAHDTAAQDALAEAVRLSAQAVGQESPTPDPLVRSAVRERLRPAMNGLAAVFRRRPYRGHPLTWTSLGATAAAVLFALGAWPPERAPTVAPNVVNVPLPAVDPGQTARQADAPAGGGGGGEPVPMPMTTFLPANPILPTDGRG